MRISLNGTFFGLRKENSNLAPYLFTPALSRMRILVSMNWRHKKLLLQQSLQKHIVDMETCNQIIRWQVGIIVVPELPSQKKRRFWDGNFTDKLVIELCLTGMVV